MKKFLGLMMILGAVTVLTGLTGCGKGHKAEAKRQAEAQKAEQTRLENEKKTKEANAKAEVEKAEEQRKLNVQTTEVPKTKNGIRFLHSTVTEQDLVTKGTVQNASDGAKAEATRVNAEIAKRALGACKEMAFTSVAKEGFGKGEEKIADAPSQITLAVMDDEGKAVEQAYEVSAAKGSPSFFINLSCNKK